MRPSSEQGIIIDNFSQLRDENEKTEKDIKEICFICEGSSDELKRKNEDFKKHIERHDKWKYIFYISYIKDKFETEYTGVESYVAQKLKRDDISWFPNSKLHSEKPDSHAPTEEGSGADQDLDALWQEFESNQKLIAQKITTIDSKVTDIDRKLKLLQKH